MSRKGEKKSNKALSAPRAISTHRKEKFWSMRVSPGMHKREAAIPLGMLIRDFTEMASSLGEAKTVLEKGAIKVDGTVRKDAKFGVGLFDSVSVDAQKKHYRVLIDKKGMLFTKEMNEKSNEKLCRVESKKANKKGVQLATNDGRLFFGKANVGDTLKIKVPENKIEKVLPLKKDAIVYITGGSHPGEKAKIEEVVPGTASREKLVKLKTKENEFETTTKNVFVVGEKEEELEELKGEK